MRIVIQRLDLFCDVYELIEPFKVSLNLYCECQLPGERLAIVKEVDETSLSAITRDFHCLLLNFVFEVITLEVCILIDSRNI